MNRHVFAAACLVGIGLISSAAPADVVIGDWEESADGWIDWGTQATLAAPKYTFSSAVGVTRGTSSLKVTQTGYNQNLSIKLQNNALIDDFFANSQLSIDVTVPGGNVAGFAEIYSLAINAQDYGFVDQPPVPKQFFGFPNGNAQTATVSWDYSALVDGSAANGEIATTSALVDGSAANGEIATTSGWVEFIIATNSDANHGEFYFDNARLTQAIRAGDFNRDGQIDALDIDLLFSTPAGEVGPDTGLFDLNADGYIVNTPGAAASDADLWVRDIVGTRYGDVDLNKQVAFDDLLTLAQNYGATSGATWGDGSFDGDGAVNFGDLLVLAQNYGFAGMTDASLLADYPGFAADWALAQSMVPEPASALALLGLGAAARRRRA